MALVMTRLACGGVSSEMIVRRSRAALHLVALRTKDGVASLSDLVRSSLRLRPDRIPVGEVRAAKRWNSSRPGAPATPVGSERFTPARRWVRSAASNSLAGVA